MRITRFRLGPSAFSPLVRFIMVLALLCAVGTSVRPASADAGWTTTLLDSGPAMMPVVFADSYGQLHAFWLHMEDAMPGSAQTIIYRLRTSDGTWSDAVDPLLSPPGGSILQLFGVLDQRNVIHLIVVTQTGLYYTRADARLAGRAASWLAYQMIADGPTGFASMALGADGSLYVAYTPRTPSAFGIFLISSNPDGDWDTPQRVAEVQDPGGYPLHADIAVARSGRIHVAWSETVDAFPPSGVYYTYSDDRGRSWNTVRRMAQGGYNWIGIGLESDENNVHLVWTGTADVRGKYHALSTNGGKDWGRVETFVPGWFGFHFFPRFALDSRGTLHMVDSIGGSLPSSSVNWAGGPTAGMQEGEMWHSAWTNGRWTVPDQVSAQVTTPKIEAVYYGIAVTGGNQLNVVWSSLYHPDKVDLRIWYSSRSVDAPRVDPQPLPPTPLPRATRTPRPTAARPTAAPTRTPLPDFSGAPVSPTAGDLFSSSITPLAVAVVPAAFLAVGMLLIGRSRRGHRS